MERNRPSNLMDHVNSLGRAISRLASHSHVFHLETRLDKHYLVAAGNFLHVLASEIKGNVERSCNIIAFNIPDLIPVNGLRDQLTVASGMGHIPWKMTRLRKRTQRHSCPLMLQFHIKGPAKLFISKQGIIAAITPCKNKNNHRRDNSVEGKCFQHFARL